MSTAIHQAPQRSDENLVVTAMPRFLVAALILGTVAYRYFKHSQQQEQTRSERQAYKRYNDYLDSTEQATAKPAANPPPRTGQRACRSASMAEKLLSHPAVTPGPASTLRRTADRRGHHRCDGSRPGNPPSSKAGRLCLAARQLSASPDRRRQAAACPVMKPLSSDARNSTGPATSSGPRQPPQRRGRHQRFTKRLLAALCALRRIDQTGRHTVDADAHWPELAGQIAAEGQQGPLDVV
jgi:hypothetical protein